MGRPFLLGTLAVLVAVIAGCGGGSSSTAHETSTLNPFPHGEGQAAQIASIKAARRSGTKRGTQPGVHAWGSKGCMTEPGNVAMFNLFTDVPVPSCIRVTPNERVLVVNRTGAYRRSEGRVLTVHLGGYSARIGPQQAALFVQPVGSYLALGWHPIRRGGPGGGPGVEVLRRDCEVAGGRIPNSCFTK